MSARRTIRAIVVAHVIASYASMVALGILGIELDGRLYHPLIWRTVAAPVAAPLTVIGIVVGMDQFKPLAAVVIMVVYGFAFFILWRLLPRRDTPRGFPVLPVSPEREEPPR